jgi:hypothetical protein
MLWQKTIITNLNQIIPNNYHVLLFTFLHIHTYTTHNYKNYMHTQNKNLHTTQKTHFYGYTNKITHKYTLTYKHTCIHTLT